MDGTLITTASGRVFAKDRDDWKIGFPEVPGMLKQLANKEGFKVRRYKLGLSLVRLRYRVTITPFSKPPIDFKSKVPLWPDLSCPGQAKTELLLKSQQEVLNKCNCHPVQGSAAHCVHKWVKLFVGIVS